MTSLWTEESLLVLEKWSYWHIYDKQEMYPVLLHCGREKMQARITDKELVRNYSEVKQTSENCKDNSLIRKVKASIGFVLSVIFDKLLLNGYKFLKL